MKVLLAFLAVLFLVECHHFMLGSNVGRPKLYSEPVSKSANENRYRSRNITYSGPQIIQGILAYDFKGSESTVELLQGGIGYNHIKLKLRGEKSKSLHYKVYIYG